jgi:DNA-binding CsgD family transcriptional regulator
VQRASSGFAAADNCGKNPRLPQRGGGGEGAEAASMWKRALLYGTLLAAGALGLQWLDYQRLARAHASDLYVALIALAFLVAGLVLGMRLMRPPPAADVAGNPRAVASLGISPRELDVLRELAAGYSNKEIAARLDVSPNTVKTHVARLFDKLGARRRTEAISKARELGLVP